MLLTLEHLHMTYYQMQGYLIKEVVMIRYQWQYDELYDMNLKLQESTSKGPRSPLKYYSYSNFNIFD